MVAMAWQLNQTGQGGLDLSVGDESILPSLCQLGVWAHTSGLSLPRPAIEVLLLHVVAVNGPQRGPLDGVRRVLEVLAQEEAPLVCLEWTPGKLDILAPGVAYVASLEDASSNLLAHLTEAQWREIREAARSQLQGPMLLKGCGLKEP